MNRAAGSGVYEFEGVMQIKIPEQLWQREKLFFKQFHIDERHFKFQKFTHIGLLELDERMLRRLLGICSKEEHASIRGVGVVVADLKMWLKALEGDSVRPRAVKQFSSLVITLLKRYQDHWLYMKSDGDDAYLACHVNKVEYEAERVYEHSRHPEHVVVSLIWREFENIHDTHISFYEDDCVGLLVQESLARKGLFVETQELRNGYNKSIARFLEIAKDVGRQMWAVGKGTDNLDGHGDEHKYWRRADTILLAKNGDPTRCVIDVYRETDKKDDERDAWLDRWFWEGKMKTHREMEIISFDDDDKADKRTEIDEEDATVTRPVINVPTHPKVAIFDMKRHTRLRVHVDHLSDYVYDTKMSNSLVLPDDVRALIEMLVTTKGVFRDIVKGKGGGAIVLCAGPPGVGKTLTAEVYSETMKRPLYSVQCSQLGTKPDELESELTAVFERATRWNAIVLLDEADVYVSSRGTDLRQNAIVGVFLRVLEYFSGVLFLTTNRSDLVDDAIASRCIARIDYKVPPAKDQMKIWRILADVAGVKVSDKLIQAIVKKYPSLSGRDVKNLLKLSKMVSESRKQPIAIETIEFVKRFKPTVDV